MGSIPEWLSFLVALVELLQGDATLAPNLLILLIMSVVGILASCCYVAFKRRPPLIEEFYRPGTIIS